MNKNLFFSNSGKQFLDIEKDCDDNATLVNSNESCSLIFKNTKSSISYNKNLHLLDFIEKKSSKNLKAPDSNAYVETDAEFQNLKAGLLSYITYEDKQSISFKDYKETCLLKKKKYKCKNNNNQQNLLTEFKDIKSDSNNIELYICENNQCMKSFKDIKKFNKHKKFHLKKLLEKMFALDSDDENQEITTEDSNIQDNFFIKDKKAFKLEADIMNLQDKIDFLM